MNDPFPFLVGRVALTEEWTIDLPRAFKQRFEESQMVLWCPGLTVWLSVWENNKNQSAPDRQSAFAAEASPGKFDEITIEQDGVLYYSYRIIEASDDQRVAALQGFAFAEWGHLQLSIYFDDESDAELANQLLRSANSQPPDLADATVLSQACFATNMIMEDGAKVGYMYREPPDSDGDSGWRFFSGKESQAYVDDPSNTQIYPVALVVQEDPSILAYLSSPEGHYGRKGDAFYPE